MSEICFDTRENLAPNIPNMSEYLTVEFLKIANDLSKEHKHDYTEERIMATFMLLSNFYEEICQARTNNSSDIPDSLRSLPLESVQEHQ